MRSGYGDLHGFKSRVIRSFDSPYSFHVKHYGNLSIYRLDRYVKTRSFLWFLSSFPISFDLCFCFCSWTLAKQRKGWLPLTWSQSGRSRDHPPKGIAIDPECLNQFPVHVKTPWGPLGILFLSFSYSRVGGDSIRVVLIDTFLASISSMGSTDRISLWEFGRN